jgi:lipoprotein-anchoring transpeptidase ErfK/SrfK
MRFRILIPAIAVLAVASQAGAASAHASRIAATQRLAAVLTPHVAYSRPSPKAPQTQLVQPITPLTHERTRLPVLGKYRGPAGVLWLHVLLPGRPNSHAGWIKAPGTKAAWTHWAIVVDLARRSVTVYDRGASVKRFPVVIGRPSAPTPTGRFYVEESLSIIPGYPGGPYALALSARSNVYSEFDGGPGQIAFHGIFGIGGVPGTAVSHGCIRVDSADMGWLGAHIPPGVPVSIVS